MAVHKSIIKFLMTYSMKRQKRKCKHTQSPHLSLSIYKLQGNRFKADYTYRNKFGLGELIHLLVISFLLIKDIQLYYVKIMCSKIYVTLKYLIVRNLKESSILVQFIKSFIIPLSWICWIELDQSGRSRRPGVVL